MRFGRIEDLAKEAAKKALIEKPDLAKKIVEAILAKRAAAVPAA